jgi:hemerythrin-like domain-containing protein
MKTLIKRHRSLRPLSRDHGMGLVCVQRLHKAVRASENDRLRLSEQIRAVFGNLIGSYLEDEQRILSSVIPNNVLKDEFKQRHNSVRTLTSKLDRLEPAEDPGLGLLSRIADALDEYVRWEEHALFPAIENMLDDEQLEQLSKATGSIEELRSRPTQQLHASIALNKQSGLAETCGCSAAKTKSN